MAPDVRLFKIDVMNRLEQKKTKKELFRFCIVAPVVGTADLGLYFLLKSFLPINISKAISYLVGSILSYLANKHWTFGTHRPSTSEFCRYWTAQFVSLVLNVAVNRGMLQLWPESHLAAVVAASLFTGIFSFSSKKWWVFQCQNK